MLIVDGHGAVKACGESLAALLGQDPDELLGRPVCALLPDWSPFASGVLNCGLRTKGNGSRAHVRVRVMCEPLHLPNATFFVLEVRPCSRAVDLLPAEAMMVTDRRGEIRLVNGAFESMTGYGAADVAGLTPALLKSGVHDRNVYRELWDTILDGHVYRGVVVNGRKNGELYHEDKVIRPVLDSRGFPSLFLSSGRDVTAWVHKAQARFARAAV